MSGHVHPDELTELERHNSVLDCYSYCQYCAAEKHSSAREAVIQELVTHLQRCAMRLSKENDVELLEKCNQLVATHLRRSDERSPV